MINIVMAFNDSDLAAQQKQLDANAAMKSYVSENSTELNYEAYKQDNSLALDYTQNPDTGTSNMKTITDDYGNTITFDKDSPNPEASSAFSTSSYGSDAPVSPDPNYQDAAAASDAGNFGSSTSSGGGMRDSNTMDATNTYGSAAEVAGAGSDIGNLGSSVNSSLGGITDTGKMFSSATSSASGAASGELTGALGSLSSVDLKGVLGSLGGSVGVAAGLLAKAGAIGALAGALSKGMGLSSIQGLTKAVQMAAVANVAKNLVGQVSNFLKTPSNIGNVGDHAKNLATAAAANTGFPATVSVNGTNVTVKPPARPDDIINLAKGTPLTSVPPEARSVANYVKHVESNLGYTVASGEEGKGGPAPAGMSKAVAESAFKTYGDPRDNRAVVPAMEAVMFGVKAAALAKFSSNLPPVFKSLLPMGPIAGLVSKGPISLGGLTQLVGGAALGAVAGQALRSVGAGNIGAVSGVTGMLGAQALARTVGSGAIPVNIASTYGGMMLGAVGGKALGNVAGNLASNVLGTNPSTSAMISNVVGIVGTLSLTKNLTGIPVSSQVLGLAANVALRSAGVPTSIPTGVLGMAAGMTSSPLASIVGSLVSGRIPVIPTNLSIGNIGALSGLTQSLQSVGLAENIIPRSQLIGLLPGNLQNQIPTVPERMQGRPGFRNETEDKNAVAPRKSTEGETQPRVADGGPAKPALLNSVGASGVINFDAKVSKYFTLGDMTIKVHGKLGDPSAHESSPYTTSQHIEGLSWLAVNIMDVLWDNIGPIHVISGFRRPGAATPQGEHGKGAAQDITLKSQKARSGALKLADGISQLGLQKFCGWCSLESSPGVAYGWLHLGGGQGHPTAKDKKWHPTSCWSPFDASVKPKYLEGFLMRPGDR